MKSIFFLISFISISFGFCNNFKAQTLTGILPKYDAYVNQAIVNFEWNSLPNSINYTIYLAQDLNFTVNLIQSSAQVVANWNSSPLLYGVWFWKILAYDGVQITESAINKFTYFDPSQNPDLSFWLKSDAGVTLDGNGKVLSWLDQSPASYLLTQTIDSKKPTFQANSLNGYPCIRFQGGQVLSGGDILDLGITSRSMLVIGNHTVTGIGYFYAKAIANAANSRYGLSYRTNNDLRLLYIDLNDKTTIGITPRTSNFYSILMAQVDRSLNTNKISQNGNLLNTMTGLSTNHNMNSSFRFLIGAYNDATDVGEVNFLNGNITEIVFTNTVNEIEIAKIQNYLRYKYAPPINLGTDTTLNHFCAINLTAPSGFTNLIWSNGATTSIISVSQSGQYWVQGTDVLGYVSRDTIQVNHPQILSPSNTNICLNDTITWDPQLGSTFTYLWSNGATTPSLAISAAGTYSVQVTDALGCIKNSGNLNFSIDNYPQTAFLGNDTTLCSGNLISLQVGAPETVSYVWNGTSTIAQSPFLAVDTTGTYTIEATNVNGCVAKDTISVIVSGTAPVVNFYISNACLGTTTILEDESVSFGTDFIAQWTWNMGDGTLLTTQNGNYVYAAPGVYPVQLYVESTGGCGAFRWDTLEIFANPTAVFTSVGNCSGQDVTFTSSSYANGAPLASHYWSFGMQPPNDPVNFSTLQAAMRNYLSAGSYPVSLLVTDTNSCTDEALTTLVINPTPIVQFAVDDACVSAEVQFTDESTTANFSTYLWNFGNNGTSLLTNPITSYASPGSRTVSLLVTSPVGCVGTGQGQLMVHANPVAVMDLGPYCKGTYTDVSDISTVLNGSIDSSYWIFNQVDTVYGSDVQYMFQTLGQQQVVLNTISNYGCKTSLSEFIEVTAELNAAFGVGTGITAAGAPFNFTNLSTGSAIYLWNFGDNTISNALAPEHTYGEAYIDSTLQVALYALNVQGCVDTAYQSMLIERAKIDLELSYLYVQKQKDWHVVGVKMTNRGTTPLKKILLSLETDKGFLYQETWTGDLKPLQDTIYVFGAKPAASISDQNTEESFVCVQAIGYDLFQEEETILWNNYLCRNIEGENVILKPVYPNPVHGEMTVELIVSKDSEVSIQLFDAMGRAAITLVPEQLLSEGNYSYTVNTAHLSSGAYFLRMVTKENVVMEKISLQ